MSTNLPDTQRVTVAVSTPLANNPIALRILKKKPQTHQQKTCCNTLGSLPRIIQTQFHLPLPALFTEIEPNVPTITFHPNKSTATPQQSNCLNQPTLPCMQKARIISQEAVNHLVATKCNQLTPQQQNLDYYTMPVAHHVTGEHITSCWCLMQDPSLQRFGWMIQGNEKMGTKGTDAIFVMDPEDVPNIQKNQLPKYARVVIADLGRMANLKLVDKRGKSLLS